MLTFVSYDISEDKSRNHLIKKLMHFGLHRIQKSLFAGNLDLNERIDLSNELEIFLSSEKDSIMIFPICESCKSSLNIFSDNGISLPEELEFKFV
jgi:CRISPR-associated protein Cas2